jgi:Xaa-Pro aminopeptidase
MNDLEIDRARRQAAHCHVISLSACWRKLQRQNIPTRGFAQVIRLILRERRIKKVLVPAGFSYGLARELRRLKIKVRLKEGSCFPQRELKTADEVRKISAALIMAEVGLAEAVQALKSARIGKGGRLIYHNAPLTSEKLRSIIDVAVLQAGGLASHTIVAGGKQACEPHEAGHGQLRAHQPIILDVFPRSQKTGYFGDITRTVVKGRANEPVRKLYHTVAQGQDLAFEKLRHNVSAVDVHRAVQQSFQQAGYRTGRRDNRAHGFFHGTGHGLGLELHEAPRLNATSEDVLRAGHVVTVEPGLYYPGLGGVRIEDVALITTQGPRNLTKFEKVLEV